MLDRKVAVAVCATTVGFALASTTDSFANSMQGTVTTGTLNIRSGPSTGYSVVTKAYRGNKVEILESSNGWYKVKLSNGKIGWGSGSYISTSDNSGSTTEPETPSIPETPPTSTGKKGTITTGSLNIRSGPSTSYGIVTKASKGQSVEILESSNGWYKVKLSNGKIGWGSGSYISTSGNSGSTTEPEAPSIPETPPTSTGKKGTITTGSLNIRSGPSTSYGIVTKVSKGQSVEILESSNGWYKVKLSNGKIGWGSSSYISTLNNVGGEDSSNGGSSNNNGSENSSNNGSSDNIDNNESNTQNRAQAVVNLAKAQLGKPYVWGAEGPNSFDCSGLTYYVYGQNGVKLPRVSRDQYSVGTYVSLSNLKPGDLLFSSTDGSGNITHVGIYIGNGEMVHAPKPGENVQKANINSSYWQKAHVGAKRVL